MVFVKQSLFGEEQRREKPSVSGDSEAALKSAYKYGSKKWKTGNYFSCGHPGHFAQNCLKQKQKQKSTKGCHHAKKAEEQEDTDSKANDIFVAIVILRADTQNNDWIIDSGASQHITFECSLLHDYKNLETPELVGLDDGHAVSAIGVGKVKVITQLHNGG